MPVSSSESTSRSLLVRVRLQEPAAWARLCRLYAPLVYSWCRRAGLQDSDAQDVGQEVFRVVHQKITSFRREAAGESFRAWLRGITRNKLREHFRRRAAHPPLMDGDGAAPLSEEPAHDHLSENAAVMRRALAAIRSDFDDSTWQAFWRMTIDGQTSAAVAEELNTTPGAVRQAKFRVLKRLREELDGLL
jgi:RNA polymerase sigma-70 factor, ECF subfamily